MINQTNKIFDYFLQTGIDQNLQPTNHQFQKELKLTDLEIYVGYLPHNINKGSIQNKTVNQDSYGNVWLDLIGNEMLWLKCSYNEPNKMPITSVDFCYFKKENDYLVTPIDNNNITPTKVKQLPKEVKLDEQFDLYKNIQIFESQDNNQQEFDVIIDNQKRLVQFKGNYNIVKLIEAENYPDYELVLAYKRQSEYNYDDPISVLDVAVGQKQKKKIHGDLTYVLPKQFQVTKNLLAFGIPKKNRIIVYKQKENCFQQSFEPKILDRYPQKDQDYYPLNDGISNQCFPQGVKFYKEIQTPQSFGFVMTDENAVRTYCTCLIFSELIDEKIHKALGHIKYDKKNQVYYEKSICLVSHYPYFQQQKELLKHIYRLHLSKNQIPIERYIQNIVDDIKLPSNISQWGKTVEFSLGIGMQPIQFETNINFPVFNKESIKILFQILDIDKIISLVECILLEKQIYLISKHKSLITHASYALISLIHPFKWINAWIPILPDNIKESLNAPFPFIMGIDQNNPNHAQGLQSDSISVYLDSNDLLNIESLPSLPEKHYKQLLTRLKKYQQIRNQENDSVQEYIEHCDNAFHTIIFNNTFDQEFDSYVIKDAFFEFICSLMKGYAKYIFPKIENNDGRVQMCSDIMDTAKFLKLHDSTKKDSFLQTLVDQTQTFPYFIEQRYFQNPQSTYFAFFDKCISSKRTKKQPLFIESNKSANFIQCPQVNTQNLVQDKIYVYDRFPIQNVNNMIIRQDKDNLTIIEQNLKNPSYILGYQNETKENEYKNLQNLSDLKWNKLLLQQIFFLWYQVFLITMKQNLSIKFYSQLTDYSLSLLDQLIQEKVIQYQKEEFYHKVIEACGYQGKTDDVKKIYEIMKLENNNNLSPQWYGIYFKAIEHTCEYKKEILKQERKQARLQQKLQQEKLNNEVLNSQNEQITNENSNNNNNENDVVQESEQNIKDLPFSLLKNIIFELQNECQTCKQQIDIQILFAGFNKSQDSQFIKCINPKCTNNQIPFMMNIYDNVKCINIANNIRVYSPFTISQTLNSILEDKGHQYINFTSQEFREKLQPSLFWNIIFYLKFMQLPIFFLEQNDIFNYNNTNPDNWLYKNDNKEIIKDNKLNIKDINEYFKQEIMNLFTLPELKISKSISQGAFMTLSKYFSQDPQSDDNKSVTSKDSNRNKQNYEQQAIHSTVKVFKQYFKIFQQQNIKIQDQNLLQINNNTNLNNMIKKESDIVMGQIDEGTQINSCHTKTVKKKENLENIKQFQNQQQSKKLQNE